MKGNARTQRRIRSCQRRRYRVPLFTQSSANSGDDTGHVKGVEVIIMELGEPDASGRRKPIAKPDTEYCIDADIVIMAIGTDANPLLTKEVPGLTLSKEGYIEVDEKMQSFASMGFRWGRYHYRFCYSYFCHGCRKKSRSSYP